MLVGVVIVDDTSKILELISNHSDNLDVIELRLDYLFNNNNHKEIFSNLQEKIKRIFKPVIFTLRSTGNTGSIKNQNKLTESDRLEILYNLCELGPDYIDLEHTIDKDFVKKIHIVYPNIKIIRSYHDFHSWDYVRSQQILTDMQQDALSDESDYIYKIIGTAKSSLDCFDIFKFIKHNISTLNIKLTAHLMGEVGGPSRILGAIAGNYFTYVALGGEGYSNKNLSTSATNKLAAPGILNISQILDIYNYKKLNSKTNVYGLIGNPVRQSKGHLYHNRKFKHYGINAVYLKFKLENNEVEDFIDFAKNNTYGCVISGLSVTMPLKHEVIKYVGNPESAKKNILSSYNTIKIIKNKNNLENIVDITNTDGIAALEVMGITNGSGASLCVFGAGGTAEAIVYEALNRGINVTIVNRTKEKAKLIADKFTGNSPLDNKIYYLSIDELGKLCELYGQEDSADQASIIEDTEYTKINQGGYDYIILALPMGMKTVEINNKKINLDYIISKLSNNKTKFMDVNYTNYLSVSNIINIPGGLMFERQAQLQFQYWMGVENGK